MRDSRIHRRIDDMVTEFISEYIANMTDAELFNYVRSVFVEDPDEHFTGHDSEIAINCAMAAFGRASDTKNRDATARRNMNLTFMKLSRLLEHHEIITQDEIKELCAQ